MRKSLLVLFCVILGMNPKAQELLDTVFANTVFWQISKQGSPNRFYLFGTAHPIFREDIHIADTVLSLIRKAPFIYFENVPGPDDEAIARMTSLMKKPNLKHVLGVVGYNKLLGLLKEMNRSLLDDSLLNQRVPQYINSQLILHEFGDLITTVDEVLIDYSLKEGKTIIGLDNPETRIKLANFLSVDQQSINLYRLVDDFKKSISDFIVYTKAMAARYNKGEIGYLFTRSNYIRVNDQQFGSYVSRKIGMEELLDKRNLQWVRIIAEAGDTDGAFFAFGAAHLPGRNGILTLLKQKGFIVAPVFFK
jgi:uncharacterized protein YbaP (TraB family)